MNPQNQNQQTGQPNQQNGGAWDFLQNQAPPPKKPSFFKQNKLIIILTAVIFLLLVVVTIAAVASSGNTSSNNGFAPGDGEIVTATTEVTQTIYDGEYLTASHPEFFQTNIDERIDVPNGWYLNFTDDVFDPTYDFVIEVSDEEPQYFDGEHAISEALEVGVEPSNPQTTNIVLGGVPTKKTIGEYSSEQGKMFVVYTQAEIDGEYLSITAKYRQDITDITDSFDVIAASIVLK